MNFKDYEEKYLLVYQAFAEMVRFILEKALLTAVNLPRPQSIQCRAKGIESLRHRLVEAGKLDTQTLDLDRHDLAGVRLIFYTNNDVDRFLASPLMRENFEIEEDSTRVHHPTPENKEKQYRAVHYTVWLREDRIRLPEYTRFAGLRCEIQVQTILNHAWSETSHDILYKGKMGDGYGGKAMKGIALRFDRIMEKYLIPAGFEIQMAQQEYERVLRGKELFDEDIAKLLDNAKNNNERYEVLSKLKDYAIPNYDDLLTVYEGLKAPLLRAVKAARETAPVLIETTYGNMEGFKPDAIAKLVVEIIDNLRYVDAVGTLQLLADIYKEEPNEGIRKQIVNAVKNLSEYNIDVYNKIGPMLQMALVDYLASLSDVEVDNIRTIALTVWAEAIQSDITGVKWKANSVTWRTGAVPASDQLKEVRDKAISALFAAYDRSISDEQKRAVLSALDAATRVPSQTKYSAELLVTTLKDASRIVDFMTERSSTESFQLLQHLEHQFLYDYFRAEDFTKGSENRFNCQTEAKALMDSILKFRDTINANIEYVQYKVLVGYDSVYPSHWADREYYQKAEEYRREEANRYINEINESNENDWFNLIILCAETKSNDLATFPVFGTFISNLAQHKPEVAARYLEKASEELYKFLAGFLNGLALSNRPDIYEQTLERELEKAKNLWGIARHLRYSNIIKPDIATRLLKLGIDKEDSTAVIECLMFALEYYGTEKISSADTFVRDILNYLNSHQDARWISEAWYMQKKSKFYEGLNRDRMNQVIQNLNFLPRVDYQAETILDKLAKCQPEIIWDYFEMRLTKEKTNEENESKERYEAVPFQFHVMHKELSKDIRLAISKGFSWYMKDQGLFRFRGGRLLSNIYPKCPSEFANNLAEMVKNGSDNEAEFVLEVLRNYEGEPNTHLALKEIVNKFPNDNTKMIEARIVIDETGVVTGELGLVEAYRKKKEILKEWLNDDRDAVRIFAEKHIAELDKTIAAEQRRAETDMEMRKREYEEEDEESNNIDSNGDK